MHLGLRARALTRALAVLLMIFVPSSVSGPAAASELPPGRPLFLVATGPNNAVAERYLASLCELLRLEPKPVVRYSTIAIYRTGGGVEEIARKLFASPSTQRSVDRTALEGFSQAVLNGAQYCSGEEPSGASRTLSQAELVQAEWLPDVSLRVQHGTVGSDLRPSLDPPRYVDIVKEPGEVARAIAVSTLRSDLADVITVPPFVRIAETDRCHAGANGDEACVLVGRRLGVAVATRDDDYWVAPNRIKAEIVVEGCQPAHETSSLQHIGDEVIELSKAHLHLATLEAVYAGACNVHVRITSSSATYDTATTSITAVLATVAVLQSSRTEKSNWLTEPRGPMPAQLSVGIGRVRLLPFWAPSIRLTTSLGSTGNPSYVVAADSVVAEWVVQVKEAVLAIPSDTFAASSSSLRDRLKVYIESRGDRFAYDVLDPEQFCENAAHAIADEVGSARLWTRRCTGKVEVVTDTYFRGQTRLPTAHLRVHAVAGQGTSAIPGTASGNAVEWDTFPGDVVAPESGPETYATNAVAPGQAQGYPTELTVMGSDIPVSGLDVGLDVGGGQFAFPGGSKIAPYVGAGIQAGFLEVFSADFNAGAGLWERSAMDQETATRISVGGSLRLAAFDHLVGLGSGAKPTNLVLDVGAGYTFIGKYPYLRTKVGWMLGRTRFMNLGVAAVLWFPWATDSAFGTFGWDFQIN